MTTFTSEDVKDLLTDWFPGDVFPVNEGEYEVMSSKWPWSHRTEWTKKHGWGTVQVDQWRGLKIKVPG